MDFLTFLHSLLRYGVVLTVAFAFFANLRGWLFKRPILTGERMVTIIAMVLCHIQLVVGIIQYGRFWEVMNNRDNEAHWRFFKYEHAGTMIIAVGLITVGRMLSKRAKEESTKQRHIAIFYGIGLLLILWGIPWPFTAVGHSMGWL